MGFLRVGVVFFLDLYFGDIGFGLSDYLVVCGEGMGGGLERWGNRGFEVDR